MVNLLRRITWSTKRRRIVASSSLMVAAMIVTAGIGIHRQFSGNALTTDLVRPFAANSPLNVPIPANPELDPKNSEYVRRLQLTHLTATTVDYGNAIFDNVDANTPRYPVYVTNDYRNGGPWGSNVLYGMTIPVPDEAMPPSGTDGTVVIVDRMAGKTYYLWQFKRENSRVVTAWGAMHTLNGFGTSDNMETGRGTAAGVSQLGGTVRIEEVKNGVIDHALAFHTFRDQACAGAGSGGRTGLENPNGEFRWPAQGSDAVQNIFNDPGCLPFGMRVQLDPTLNFDDTARYPNLTRVERMMAKAMQKYGAYLIDSGGSSMGFAFEVWQPGEPTWCQLGLAPIGSWGCPTEMGQANYWNFDFMKGSLRVLKDCACGTTKSSIPASSPVTPPVVLINQTNNIATGKTFTTSGGEAAGFPLANLNNKNETDRWISNPADAVSVTTDLGAVFTLSKVSILWAGDTTRNYDLQVSQDNVTWKSVASGTTNNTNRQLLDTTTFTTTPTGRYFRIVAKDRWNAAYGNSIYEVGMYGTAAVTTALPGDTNDDSRVNALDLSLVLSRDGQNHPAADFNKDGVVGAADMAILLGKWTW